MTYKTKAPNSRAHSESTKTWMAEKSFDKGDFMKIIDNLVKELQLGDIVEYRMLPDALHKFLICDGDFPFLASALV